jgi:formate hydrogenlyase subunit 6/NADH:ubiquinone oxidoreductase subunit I
MIPVYIMGKRYGVPDTLTIMKALEYAGYQLMRGCGCRGGICGACGTVYRFPDSHKIEIGLACQTVVQPNMYLAQLPFFPAKRSPFHTETIEASVATFQALYPEVFKCVSCNTCTKSCPMDIEVMDYVNAIMRGDIEKTARLSFDCIMCGLCTSRCPAEISHYNAAILARRIYGKLLAPKARHLTDQVKEIQAGRYDEDLEELREMGTEVLGMLYTDREIEPQMADETWRPEIREHLLGVE